MPIEIRELVIKATVDTSQDQSGASAKPDQKTKQAIVAECVEQVMEIIRQKQER